MQFQKSLILKFVRPYINLVNPHQTKHITSLSVSNRCTQNSFRRHPVAPNLSKIHAEVTINNELLAVRRFYSKFTAAREPFVLGSQPLCEKRAHDLISNIKDSERAAIKIALEKYEAIRLKEGLEAEKVINPSTSDLAKIFFVNAVPFIAFGFLDNSIMIISGDYIEQFFGTYMSISTMAAAALGNALSDIVGIGAVHYVEHGCEMLGLQPPDLTPIQMKMKSSLRSATFGRMVGITAGCLLGMVFLLFMDKKPTEQADIKTT